MWPLTAFEQHRTLLRVERIFVQLHRTRQRRRYPTAQQNKQVIVFLTENIHIGGSGPKCCRHTAMAAPAQ